MSQKRAERNDRLHDQERRNFSKASLLLTEEYPTYQPATFGHYKYARAGIEMLQLHVHSGTVGFPPRMEGR